MMIEWIKAFEFTGWMGIALYWLPGVVCAYGYTVRTWLNYQKDVADRRKAETEERNFYHPTDTIGTLIGRGIVTVLPVANLWAAALDVAPQMLDSFFKWVGRVFDTPLVPRRDA